MKISEMIEELQRIQQQYGDVNVLYDGDGGSDKDAEMIEVSNVMVHKNVSREEALNRAIKNGADHHYIRILNKKYDEGDIRWYGEWVENGEKQVVIR